MQNLFSINSITYNLLNFSKLKKNYLIKVILDSTVTSRLFTHIVSTEKVRKDMRDRKDMRGTNYTYYISCFLILVLIKSRLGTFPLLTTYLLYLYISKQKI